MKSPTELPVSIATHVTHIIMEVQLAYSSHIQATNTHRYTGSVCCMTMSAQYKGLIARHMSLGELVAQKHNDALGALCTMCRLVCLRLMHVLDM